MRRKLFWVIFLCVYFGVYLAIFPGDFYYDDYHSIRNNSWLVSLRNLPRFFFDPGCFSARPRAAMYRPFLLVSYALDYQIYQWRVWGWHLSNLFLHLFNVLLVWVLVRGTFQNERLAWLAGLLYAFHPVAGENINYLNCRSSLLLTTFVLAGLNSISRVIDAEAKGTSPLCFWMMATIFFGVGLLSKETGAVFPGVAFLYYWFFSKKKTFKKVWSLVLGLLPMLLLLIGYLFLRQHFFGRMLLGPVLPRGLLINFYTELKSYFWYPLLFLFPTKLSIEHSFQVEERLVDLQVLASLFGLLGLGGSVLYFLFRPGSRFSFLGFFLGSYLLILAPTSSIVPLNVLVSERAFYPALFALVVLLAMLIEVVFKRSQRGAIVILAILLVNYLGMIGYRARLWQSCWGIWSDAFKKAPDLPRVIGELANEYARRGEEEKAVKYFLLSDEKSSGHPATVFNLGAIYMDLGRLEEAERYLEQAVDLEPEDFSARVNLGTVYQALGKWELARYQFERALELNPKSALAHNNLGDLYFKMGELGKAEEQFLRALSLDPKLELAHYNLGLVYDQAGLFEEALTHFERAYEENPGQPDNSLQVGVMLLKLNQPKSAEGWIRKSLALDGKYAIAWYYWGLAKVKEGEKAEALSALENSLKFLREDQSFLKAEIETLLLEIKNQR